jgi:hypothetical protein
MNAYGKLEWEFTACVPRINFLDLDIKMTPTEYKQKSMRKR